MRSRAGERMQIVVLGLSITSSWGNGHATTYRALIRSLRERGHDVLFLERDTEWYATNRDLPNPPYCRTELYTSLGDLRERFAVEVRSADLVIVGSYVPQGVFVGEWVLSTARGVVAFYDIDTPVTLAKLERGDKEYVTRSLVSRYDLYLSFTGGPTLQRLERQYRTPCARVLYCSVDPTAYYPEKAPLKWDMGYLGTYSDDRQPTLDALLVEPARQMPEANFAIAGPMYPDTSQWPANVTYTSHLPPDAHRDFYNSQRFTLNVTRRDMIQAGYSPSVRLFEAGACGTPIISDYWNGLGELFDLGREILVAKSPEDTLRILRTFPEEERLAMGERLRRRILREHTCDQRAEQLEGYALALMSRGRAVARRA
jgi:spore maturation protein CgeB